MAKALISGIGGFIGSHLADYLIEQGHEVVGLDNFLTGDSANINPKAKFYEADIRDLDRLSEIFDIENPDWVFHEAANARTQVSVDDPQMDMGINIQGTLNMLLTARDSGVKRFVYASSCIVYAPNTPYYVSKQAGEEYTKVFNKVYGMSTVALRYSNVYGSLRQSEKGSHINAIASLRKSKRETGRIWLTKPGDQVREWSHVIDVARANLMAAQSDASGVYDITTGKETSMRKIAEYFNCPIDIVAERPGDQFRLGPQNPEPAYKAFGYKYSIDIGEESLRPYLE